MILLTNNLPIKLVYRKIQNIEVNNNTFAYREMVKLAKEYQQKFHNVSVGDIPGIQHARSFFRAIGIDPTKRRPSSEALLRRAISNKELYQVSNIVDVGNWCSLEFMLPICVYDYSEINGDINVQLGSCHDSYLAHNNREMNFENKLVLCDKTGAFGSPLTDSIRTAVTSKTKEILVVIFAPLNYDSILLESYIETMEERIIQSMI